MSANDPATYVLGDIVFNARVADGDGLRWYASLEGLGGPTSRVDVQPRQGLAGSLFSPGVNGTRQLTMTGMVVAADYAALKRARNRLAAAVNLVAAMGTLVVNDAQPYQMQVYRADELRFEPDASPTVGRFQVGLVAPDPLRYSTVAQALSTSLSSITTGVTAPVVAPVSAGGGTASQVTAFNGGTTATPVVLEIAGPVTNPVVTHDESGSVIRLALTVIAGDLLVLDSDARSILLNGVNVRSSAVGRVRWFDLAPGANTIRFAAASADPAASLTVRWRAASI